MAGLNQALISGEIDIYHCIDQHLVPSHIREFLCYFGRVRQSVAYVTENQRTTKQ